MCPHIVAQLSQNLLVLSIIILRYLLQYLLHIRRMEILPKADIVRCSFFAVNSRKISGDFLGDLSGRSSFGAPQEGHDKTHALHGRMRAIAHGMSENCVEDAPLSVCDRE